MQVVRKDGPDAGAPLPPLQEVEERAAGIVESRKVQTRANIGAVFTGNV